MSAIRHWAIGLLCLVAAFAGPAHATAMDEDAATRVIRDMTRVAIEEIATADVPQAERITRFRGLFRDYFDMPIIARLVLGRYWRTAEEANRERFVELFREVTVYRWAGLFEKYEGQELEIREVTGDGRGVMVHTHILPANGGEPVKVVFRLRPHRESGEPKVVDIVVEGVSMVITQRSEYASVINNAGGRVASLNDALADKLATFEEQGPPPPDEVTANRIGGD